MTTDKEAEDALPPGVARGLRLDTTPQDQQLQAGGIGPGGQIGPDPATRRLQEGRTYVHDDTAGHEGPISDSPVTASPTRPYGTGGAAAAATDISPGKEEE